MQKKCVQCKNSFPVTAGDLKFYEKISPVIEGKKFLFPAPDECPDCRRRQRLLFRNERFLYHRKCDLCSNEIISTFSPDKSLKVYCPRCFWGDQWDSAEYARDFDFSKDFFGQFKMLLRDVPQISLNVAQNENSDFTNYAGSNKNCYLLFSGEYDEDVYYADHTIKSRNCIDTDQTFNSELVADSINMEGCYDVQYSVNCKNCRDSLFLYDCAGCSDCLFSSNLRNKINHIFNKPFTKEQYQKEKEKLLEQISSYSGLQAAKKSFMELAGASVRRSNRSINSQDSSGDNLLNTKNCHNCYNVTNGQDSAFVSEGYDIKDLGDTDAVTEAELVFNCMSVSYKAYNILFSHHVWWSSNVSYSVLAKSCDNLFGCAAVSRRSHSIFNKTYSKDEYPKMLAKIMKHMQETGEWGKFFPSDLSPYGYNETIAQDCYPLSETEAKKMGISWKKNDGQNKYVGAKTVLPEKIADLKTDITKQILTCESCSKNYRIIGQEYSFYRTRNMPIPRYCFECRHKSRAQFQNPHKLWNRKCAKCKEAIQSTYAPARPEIVYCEKCYLEAVY